MVSQSEGSISNFLFSASCDSGFSTDSDELSFSGDESPSPVVTPQPTESDQSEAANLDASELPLSRSWTWYYLNNQSKNWDERINKIAEVKTVEDFWKTYGRIKLPTHISVGCDLMFFQRYVLNFFLPQNWVWYWGKVGCIFPTVVVSILPLTVRALRDSGQMTIEKTHPTKAIHGPYSNLSYLPWI